MTFYNIKSSHASIQDDSPSYVMFIVYITVFLAFFFSLVLPIYKIAINSVFLLNNLEVLL